MRIFSLLSVSRFVAMLALVIIFGMKAVAQNSPITLTSPNGGELWNVGETHRITWTTTGNYPEVQVGLRDSLYDPNLDLGEVTIAYRIANSGSYDFTVPASLGNLSNGILGGSNYRVAVYPWDSNEPGTESANVFTIGNTVPEPTSLSLLGIGAAGLLARRRRRIV